MTPMFPDATWQRLLRILFFLAVGSVALSVLIMVVVARVAEPPPPPRHIAYLLSPLAQRLDDPVQRQEEARRLFEMTGVMISVYARDGKRVVSNADPPLAAPTPEEWSLLNEGREQRRGEHGSFVVLLIAPSGIKHAAALEFPRRPRPERNFFLLVVCVLLVLALLSAVFATMLTSPLAELARATKAFGHGDHGARADLRRVGAFADLGKAFNEMAEKITASMLAEKELLANVSHELRTPLSRIRVALDLAEDGDSALARESLVEIGADLAELERLLEDVLTAARLDQRAGRLPGTPPLRKERVSPNVLYERAAQRFHTNHPHHALAIDVPSELPELEVDPTLMRRALDNVLDNAGKYSEPRSSMCLTARVEGSCVLTTVQDHGMGMTPEELAQLFTPFFRAERSRTRSKGGVGLGLVLCKRIVEAHGGSITVQSTNGQGTTVTLLLPYPPGAR